MNRAALLLVLVLASCSGGDGGAKPLDGATLYQRQGCMACHGPNLQGSTMAPALGGLTAHWTVDELVAYLNDPKGYAAGDERLRKQGEAYRSPMPPYRNVGEEGLRTLAAWLLEQP